MGAEWLPLRIEPDLDDPACAAVMVDVDLCGVRMPFVLDTGAARITIRRSPDSDGLERVGSGVTGGVFGTVTESVVRVPQLRLGPLVIHDLEVSVSDVIHRDDRNVLGMDVLSGHSWEIRSLTWR